VRQKSGRGSEDARLWLSLFTISLVIAICLGVAATMSGFNKPG